MGVIAQIREQRLYPRVSCELLDTDREVIRNISLNGLYLESDRPYRLRQTVVVVFILPPEEKTIRLEGEVTRREPLRDSRYGYGLRFKDVRADDYKKLEYFALYQSTKEEKRIRPLPGDRPFFYKSLVIETRQQNLAAFDPRLAQYLRPTDYLSVHDLTRDLQLFTKTTGIAHGVLTAQILHTSATLCVNELDEPMLLMDLVKKMRELVPKDADYFHNGSLREVNLCPDDSHCDRNGDAHVKAALFGHPSISLIIHNGELVLGQWQKISLLEFDGPRRREVLVQVGG